MTSKVKSEPVLIAMSVLAGLTLLFGGMGLSGLGADNATVALIGAWGTLATAASQAGIQFWVRGQVTPTADIPTIEAVVVNPEAE